MRLIISQETVVEMGENKVELLEKHELMMMVWQWEAETAIRNSHCIPDLSFREVAICFHMNRATNRQWSSRIQVATFPQPVPDNIYTYIVLRFSEVVYTIWQHPENSSHLFSPNKAWKKMEI